MIKRREHSCKYQLRREIIHKLSRTQLFWLCVLALIVLGLIGIFAPTALVGLL